MLEMHANDRKDVDEAFAGDIVALAGMKETTTGDTLCAERQPIVLERMEFPEPVIELSVEPKTKADQEKMGVALNRLSAEDPSFRVSTDHESGQTIIKGMGELHLDIIVDRMRREFKVEANVGAPQVAYREYLAQEGRRRLHPQEAVGWLGPVRRASRSRVTPGERGSGIIFNDNIKGGNIPQGIYPVGREGHARDRGDRLADRLPDHRLRDRAATTAPTMTSTRRRWRSKSPVVARCAKRRRSRASSCSSRS